MIVDSGSHGPLSNGSSYEILIEGQITLFWKSLPSARQNDLCHTCPLRRLESFDMGSEGALVRCNSFNEFV